MDEVVWALLLKYICFGHSFVRHGIAVTAKCEHNMASTPCADHFPLHSLRRGEPAADFSNKPPFNFFPFVILNFHQTVMSLDPAASRTIALSACDLHYGSAPAS